MPTNHPKNVVKTNDAVIVILSDGQQPTTVTTGTNNGLTGHMGPQPVRLNEMQQA